MFLWSFVHGEAFPWRFFLLLAFLEIFIVKIFLEIFSWRFFFMKFFLWDCSIVKICSIAHLWGLKIVLVCLYWGLKSLCWLFDSGSLAQGQISKWMLTQGWSLEFWLTQDQIWSLKWFFNFGCLFGLAFCTIQLILLFLDVSLKFWVWLLMGPIPYRRTTLSSPNTMTTLIKNDLVISSKRDHVGTEKGGHRRSLLPKRRTILRNDC